MDIGEGPDAFPDFHVYLGGDAVAVGAAREHPVGLGMDLQPIVICEVDRDFHGRHGLMFASVVQLFDGRRLSVVDVPLRLKLKLQLPVVVSGESASTELQHIHFQEEPVLRLPADSFELGVGVVPAVVAVAQGKAAIPFVTQEEWACLHFRV